MRNWLNPTNWFGQARTVELSTYDSSGDEYSAYQPVNPLEKYSWASEFDLTER